MRTSCGLPLCLSGIEIWPETRRVQRGRSPMVGGSKDRMATQGAYISSTEEARLASDYHSAPNDLPSGQLTDISKTETSMDTHISPMQRFSHANVAQWPRLALALQMADLDQRREVLKKQRSEQGPVGFIEDHRFTEEQYSGRIRDLIRVHMEDFCMTGDQCQIVLRSTCAKAA